MATDGCGHLSPARARNTRSVGGARHLQDQAEARRGARVRWAAFGFALAVSFLPWVVRSATANVIASDFGPGDAFQTSTGTAWAVAGSQRDSGAVAFNIPAGQTYQLTPIRF